VAAALPAMRKAGTGTIVVVSSWAGWRFLPFTGAAYGATKMGLGPLVESINYEEGHHGVRATLVCPGEVATPILKSRPMPPPDADIARMLQPEDVASAIAYAVTAPARVCINELVIGPSWNRIYLGADDLVLKR
jgi:NADP-dependent 3-hydroxy acid dehydrogenase YdfG